MSDAVLIDIRSALEKVLNSCSTNFTESIDLSVVVSRDFSKEAVGCVDLPSGVGKDVSIAVFVKDESSSVKELGVDVFSPSDELSKRNLHDWYLSTPDAMSKVASAFAKVLGPRGLMPNPKLGTVTDDLESVIARIKSGLVRFKSDKHGNVNLRIGSANFSCDELFENVKAVIQSISNSKPASCKGSYLMKLFVSSTMGKSHIVDLSSCGVSL